jgi:uncharacterized membrane protein
MTLAAIDWGQLFELVWAAVAATVVVSSAFSIAIVGFTRAADRRRDHHGAAATAYGVVGVVATAVFLGAFVFGITVILAK